MQYEIQNLPAFDKVIARLARKARRLSLPEPAYVVLSERAETVPVFELTENDRRPAGTALVVVHTVELTNVEPVRFDGWEYAARVEATSAGNILYAFPGVEVPARYSASGCGCEHCNAERNRKRLFIVRNAESGEYKQVGSTCLADFIGHNSGERAAQVFGFYGEIVHDLNAFCEAESVGEKRDASAFDLERVVTSAVHIARLDGWLSRSKAYDNGGTPTADKVLLALTGKPRDGATEADAEAAREAIEYFAALPVTAGEETLTRNARIIANAGYCSRKSFGLACALRVCFEVAKNKEAREAAKERQRLTSKHVGTVKARAVFTATVQRVHYYASDFGMQVITVMEDDSGNVIVGKALILPRADDTRDGQAEAGERVTFTATVKEHGEYEGVKQTKVLRASKVSLASA